MGSIFDSREEFEFDRLEDTWIIPCWESAKRSYDELKEHVYSSRISHFEWKIEFVRDPTYYDELVYLVTLTKLGHGMKSVRTSMMCSVLNYYKKFELKMGKVEKLVEENETIILYPENGIPRRRRWNSDDILDSEGSLHVNIRFTMIYPKTLAEATFRLNSLTNMRSNQLALLNDDSCADLKIVTKDGKDIMAHKLIIKAQCPEFYAKSVDIFWDFELSTIYVKDINEKTMQVLLQYFYTGELKDCWSDDDVIVEFAYAADMYKMTDVLHMLDEVLGTRFCNSCCETQVFFLKLTKRLCLQKTEEFLFNRVKSNVYFCKTAEDLFHWFDYQVDEKLLETEELQEILQIWENSLDETALDVDEVGHRDILLLNLAKQKGLHSLEAVLLKRVTKKIYNLKTTDELFSLFSQKTERKN